MRTISFFSIILLMILLSSPTTSAFSPQFTIAQNVVKFEDTTPQMRFYDVERGDLYNYFLMQAYNVFEVNSTGDYIDPRIVSLNSPSDYKYTLSENTTDSLKTTFGANIDFWTKTFHITTNIDVEKSDSISTFYNNDTYLAPTALIHYSIRFSNWDFDNMSNGLNLSFKFYSSDFSVNRVYDTTNLHFMLEKTDMMAILKPTNYISQGANRQITADDIKIWADNESISDFAVMWYEFTVKFPAQTTEMGVDFDLYIRNNQVIDPDVNRPAPFPLMFSVFSIGVLIYLQKWKRNCSNKSR